MSLGSYWDVLYSDVSHVRCQAPVRCQVSSHDKYSNFITGFFDPHDLSDVLKYIHICIYLFIAFVTLPLV